MRRIAVIITMVFLIAITILTFPTDTNTHVVSQDDVIMTTTVSQERSKGPITPAETAFFQLMKKMGGNFDRYSWEVVDYASDPNAKPPAGEDWKRVTYAYALSKGKLIHFEIWCKPYK